MNTHLAAFGVFVLFAALVACEPAQEGPAPQTAADVPPPPPAAPPSGTSPGGVGPSDTQGQADSASGPGNAGYAAGEYPIGEDTDSYSDNDPSALTDFHGALDANGSWVDDGVYGTVWMPSTAAVGPDFVPYVTAGHWVYDDDWVWVSDYPWGWAPFHYGRWVFIDGRGWGWVPGRVYRGAWVTWSVDDGYGYVGWAPMAPAFLWFGGVAVGWNVYVGPRWVYCPRGAVFSPGIGGRVVAGPAAAPIAARMHMYVGAASGGPPPTRLGYNAAEIPHGAGASAGLSRAQQFAHASTATTLGARSPTRFAAPTINSAAGGRAPFSTTRPAPSAVAPSTQFRAGTSAPAQSHSVSTPGVGTGNAHPSVIRPSTSAPSRAAPSFHGGGSGHTGGGRSE